ncbi:MAG: hypothetical protein HYY93_00720 [Planctomycetes bacterium]|nr:hypothetical protein [Planctomycetota bacterium]
MPVRRSILAALALAAALSAGGGCAHFAKVKFYTHPENPDPDLKTIAVAPFFNATSATVDAERTADLFASELVQCGVVKVERPRAVLEAAYRLKYPEATSAPANVRIQDLISEPADAVRVAKALRADAVIVGTVTESNPYFPPVLGLAIQVFCTKTYTLRAEDIDRLIQSGKPLPLTTSSAGNVLDAFERVYDSNQSMLRTEIKGYALAREGTDRSFRDEESVLRVSENFVRFCSNQMIREFFKRRGQSIRPEQKPKEKPARR